MFIFAFARAKRRSGKMSRFQFLIPANVGVAIFSLKKVSASAGDGGVCPYLFLLC